jgi:hypothetical protein
MQLNLQTGVNDPIATFLTEALQLKLLAPNATGPVSVLNVDIRYPDEKDLRERIPAQSIGPSFVIVFTIPGDRGKNTPIRALDADELIADVYIDLNRRRAKILLSCGTLFSDKLEHSETLARSVVDDVLTLLAA